MGSTIIGIAGGSGCGKTTLACRLERALPPSTIATIGLDQYYHEQRDLSEEERGRLNYDHPSSLDVDLLIKHLDILKGGVAVESPVYDFTIHTRADTTLPVEPRPVIILEGILALVDVRLRKRIDISIYVDTPPDLRFIRRLQRDIKERGRTMESVCRQYLETVRPMHQQFVKSQRIFANTVLRGDIDFEAAVTTICERLGYPIETPLDFRQ